MIGSGFLFFVARNITTIKLLLCHSRVRSAHNSTVFSARFSKWRANINQRSEYTIRNRSCIVESG